MINKKLYLFVSLILGLGLSLFISCGDDDNNYMIDEVWKGFNDSLYYAHEDSLEKNGGEYTKLECLTRNGYIYYKRSSEIEPVIPPTEKAFSGSDFEITPKVSENGRPYATDSVNVRYMGWYYAKNTDGSITRITFDGTEGDFNKVSVGFRLNDGLTSGFSSMIQRMDIKDLNQVLVAIPYNLAYGEYGKSDSSGKLVIPGYTTLYFNILLEEIIPDNPGEYPDVDLGGLK